MAQSASTPPTGMPRRSAVSPVNQAVGGEPNAGPPGAPVGQRSLELGSIEFLQVLAEDGTCADALAPTLSNDELKHIHRAMVLTRKLDQRMLAMQRQGEMGTFAPGIGQEATQIGQVFPLQKRDWFSPSYRSFGAQLWRGWSIEQLLLLWDGFFEGFAPPADVNDLPFSIVIGSHVPLAVGIAMGMRIRKDESVALCNFGDGALSQGIVAEAMNFAAVFKSPCVFVCENNGYAISMPAEKQHAVKELARRAPGFGIPGITVDGNDVLAMIRATQHAVEHARNGGGPFFIEAVTYRLSLHTTADDPKVYRNDEEVEQWKARCPIARYEAFLMQRGVLSHHDCERTAQECEQEVLEARERFRKRAVANPKEVFDFVYAELPPELEAQKREYLDKLKRKGVE